MQEEGTESKFIVNMCVSELTVSLGQEWTSVSKIPYMSRCLCMLLSFMYDGLIEKNMDFQCLKTDLP